MRCPKCQHENPPGSRFCLDCGVRLSLKCTACGAELPSGAKFCNACGGAVPEAAPAGGGREAPGSYTPKHLADRILASRSALEGERKQVTVLFADIKGSMELLAERDPEDAREILDPVLERMMEAVHRYEGTVNQVMGDGIMALFGAPLAHEDHAVRACYAALAMQDSVRRYAQSVRRSEGIPIQIRVGLNSGEVVVRSIGSDLHMDYTAVGQTTHLAARMEQMATPGSILITADALRLAEGFIQVAPIGPVPVKGLPTPVEVYELTSAGAARTRLQAAAARGLTRFVGRQREIDALADALTHAGKGQGQVVALLGEPGVGKSRLLWEFTHSHRTHGWLILESGSVSYGKATPYLPVIDLLKAYFKIGERDEQREIREKVTGKLLTLDRSLEPTLLAFLSLLDVPVEDTAWRALDPQQRRQATLDAIKRLLLKESRVQPLILVFEDLHWIDSETQALLDSLIESLPAARLLLLINYRPEYQHGWTTKTYYTQLRLDPLSPENAQELLQALLGLEPSVEGLKRMLIERTEGNPFFLEESVRNLVETSALSGERGAYRLVPEAATVEVAPTVQALLAARIDRLAPEDKRLLQTAAVIGKDFPYALLQAIAGSPEAQLHAGLARLQAAEFLYETTLYPDLEYTFKHALTHDVAYSSLLQERRRVQHAQIVEAIERVFGNRLAENVDRLAHHALRGEIWDKAVLYSRQAGDKAFERFANADGAAYFEQALAALKHLPPARETTQQEIDLNLDLRNPLLVLARFDRLQSCLEDAVRACEALQDTRRLARACIYLAHLHFLVGETDRAIDAGQRALALAEQADHLPERIISHYYLGMIRPSRGEYAAAVSSLRRGLELIGLDLVHERLGLIGRPSVFARAHLALTLAQLGQFGEAIQHCEDARRICQGTQGSSWDQLFWTYGLGATLLEQGFADRAVAALAPALQLCEERGNRLMFPILATLHGAALCLAGHADEGVVLLRRSVDGATRLRPAGSRALWASLVAEGFFRAGRADEAMRHASEVLAWSRERRDPAGEARALRLSGDIHAHPAQFEPENAEHCYRQALTLAEELGMRPLAAHCRLGLGCLYRRTGRTAEARPELSQAREMYREMDMPFYLEQAEAELKRA